MAHNGRSVFQRIRSVKNSLDNAEQSFLENNGMRGELDLLLAEAELKNLRSKQVVPWSWNRQILAMCVAVSLALAGVVGWYYAHNDVTVVEKPVEPMLITPVVKQVHSNVVVSADDKKTIILPGFGERMINNQPASGQADYKQQVNITVAEMRRLVQSARVELSDSK